MRRVVYDLARLALCPRGQFHYGVVDTAYRLALFHGFQLHDDFCILQPEEFLTPCVAHFQRITDYGKMRELRSVLQDRSQSEFYFFRRIGSVGNTVRKP